ncbi:amino acid ABC transporter permease [Gordonibacter sp.]|uniref:amino acid ABC transporter permease n=3 Tax=Gordonibacter sp. TaxID=1968902 RepID=UPI002FCA798B
MQTATAFARKHFAGIAALMVVAMLAASFVLPVQAHALEVERWTAKSNTSGETKIMGETPTRVTWQGQSAENESLTEVSVDLPAGSSIEAENVKTTVMSGLDRLEIASQTAIEGAKVTVSFPEPTPAGSLVMIEFNRTLLPAAGGTFGMTGSYTTVDGQVHDLATTDQTFDVVGTSPTEQLSVWLGQQDWVKAWNSNKFLHLFFDPTIIVTSIPTVFAGWLISIGLVILSFPLAIPLGLVWAFLRMAKSRILRAIGATYINIVRGTPLFLQLYIVFFGLPLMGITMDNFLLAAIVLVVNSSAYLAEIFRAGIQSISKGQFEAARSLGMNSIQTMFFVIIPQTVKRVIPTMTSEFILMYKDTSLMAAVGVMELMMYAKTITAATGNVTPYIVAAGYYLIVTIPLTKLINTMELRMAGGRRKRKKQAHPAPEAELVPGSDAAVARNIRMSETFAGPASQVDYDECAYSPANRNSNSNSNHMSH